MGSTNCSSASDGVPHLQAWVRVERGIPHVKGHNSVLRLVISKNKCMKKLIYDLKSVTSWGVDCMATFFINSFE
jgi:hypothetical protein